MSSPVTEALNRNLAAAQDLHCRAKHAHWNCTGANFLPVHKLFDDIAESAEGYADTMAEQTRFLGVEAYGTATAAAKSFLGPYTVGIADTAAHLRTILTSLELFAASTKAAISTCLSAQDQATADIFIEITRAISKDVYLVRSHLR